MSGEFIAVDQYLTDASQYLKNEGGKIEAAVDGLIKAMESATSKAVTSGGCCDALKAYKGYFAAIDGKFEDFGNTASSGTSKFSSQVTADDNYSF